MHSEFLRALEELRFDRIARHPKVFGLFVKPVASRKFNIPGQPLCKGISNVQSMGLYFFWPRPRADVPWGVGDSSCLSRMPSLMRHSTNRGSSSASRTI